MFELDGKKLNYLKKIHAYMKREGIDFSETEKYINISDEEIKEKYIIKGEVNWKTIQGAKKVSDLPTEHEMQVQICKWLKNNNIGHFAIPNGFVHNGANKLDTAKYINYLISEGYKKGMFDLVILPGNGKIGFLELKTERGTPSDFQIKWLNWFVKNNYPAKICYGYKDAIDFIKTLL